MYVVRVAIGGTFLLGYTYFKVDKDSFGNIEWLASGSFVLLYLIAILLASLVDNLNKDK
jgi:hypothetical protein